MIEAACDEWDVLLPRDKDISTHAVVDTGGLGGTPDQGKALLSNQGALTEGWIWG